MSPCCIESIYKREIFNVTNRLPICKKIYLSIGRETVAENIFMNKRVFFCMLQCKFNFKIRFVYIKNKSVRPYIINCYTEVKLTR